MKRKDKKPMLIFLEPNLKEMIMYKAYKENKSQNYLIEEILKNRLEKDLEKDIHFKELANVK